MKSMSPSYSLRLSWRMLLRDARAGELHLLALALVIAVASVTTVSFFADRVERALSRQANQLLGADLMLSSNRYFAEPFADEARRRGLAVVRTARFPSMVSNGDEALLAQIRAVTPGYPLRGAMKIADAPFGAGKPATDITAAGTVWIDDKLANRLRLAVDDAVHVGNARLNVAAVLVQEPDSAVGFFNLAPRLILNYADLHATGLIQTGSRIRYQLLVAGDAQTVDGYRTWAAANIAADERVESVRDARPEIRSALDRAGSFLGLAALVAVILAAVAVALAARRFLQRHLDGCAVMRCVGARQPLILRLYMQQFLILAIAASALGCALGYVAQYALAHFLSALVSAELPQPSLLPAAHGFVAGLLLLFGFALPPLISLGRVPTLRVIRREIGPPKGLGSFGYMIGFAAIAALILWQAYDLKLGIYILAGFTATLVVSGGAVWWLLGLLRGAGTAAGISWRYGIANLRRRALGSVVQIVALALGLMALLVLTLIRGDLLNTWRTSLPADAPNRFLVNVQPDQLQPLADFFTQQKIAAPEFYPMVRGRLTAINGNKVNADDYADEQAKRLVDREFNLSWGQELSDDNRLLAGRWWDDTDRAGAFLSVEEGIAQTLGIKLGDRLTYEIAGEVMEAEVASLRKVDWDSFRVNFFVLASPGVLDDFPVSYVTSFYLPQARADLLNQIVKAFPNLLVIDVAAIVTQVRAIMDQVVSAVEFVFLFTLASGVMVLFAALESTQDERVFEAAIMRALGASRRQLRNSQAAEFVAIGALAGVLAAAGASVLGFVIADRVLHLPYSLNPTVWFAGIACGAAGVLILGLFGTRTALNAPPLATLRKVA